MIIVKNNVVVENITTQEVLETEKLFWDQKRQKLYTSSLVKISSPEKIIYGDSMVANEDFTHREIFGIRATIELNDE